MVGEKKVECMNQEIGRSHFSNKTALLEPSPTLGRVQAEMLIPPLHWPHTLQVGYQPALVLWYGEPNQNPVRRPDELMRRSEQTWEAACVHTVGNPKTVSS